MPNPIANFLCFRVPHLIQLNPILVSFNGLSQTFPWISISLIKKPFRHLVVLIIFTAVETFFASSFTMTLMDFRNISFYINLNPVSWLVFRKGNILWIMRLEMRSNFGWFLEVLCVRGHKDVGHYWLRIIWRIAYIFIWKNSCNILSRLICFVVGQILRRN